ncbi:MAG: type II toxin-antitoxin system PemK/MazF family toxin [Actinomycetota bacterium]|jgi:mRNA interferase MazF|nr:MazF family transcriptional regulator [Ahrensia sp.]MEC9323270.1 type II toxin-antitoxin system PemK/MazF family toxin [Actinomycetota bacterium]
MTRALRSQAYRVDLGYGSKPWVILSNNSRNRNLDTVLAARITTTSKHAHVPTVVALTAADPLLGYVLVDDIVQLYHDELTEALGTLSVPTMAEISKALRIALP